MNIWEWNNWYDALDSANVQYRQGLRLRFDKGVDPLLREECLRFARWLRQEYKFPIRVPIYIKNWKSIKCIDGGSAFGTCFIPNSYKDEPYIRIAVGDYAELSSKWGKRDATLSILRTIAHELTHYYQWINGVQLTQEIEERQATKNSKLIIEYYLGFVRNNCKG